jgi:hypothetical protein
MNIDVLRNEYRGRLEAADNRRLLNDGLLAKLSLGF